MLEPSHPGINQRFVSGIQDFPRSWYADAIAAPMFKLSAIIATVVLPMVIPLQAHAFHVIAGARQPSVQRNVNHAGDVRTLRRQ